MSSGFVSGGTIEEPNERDDEWHRVQQELEEERRRKAELGQQDGGKSLYEVLQQNKMAKQEAFEESIRLKNQFRALDEDEVEFLDSLLESTRSKEAAVQKETAEHLAEYQRQREEAERILIEGSSKGQNSSASGTNVTGDEENWAVAGRKRRRNKKDTLMPLKIRKSSSAAEDAPATSQHKSLSDKAVLQEEDIDKKTKEPVQPSSQSVPTPTKTLSDEGANKRRDTVPTEPESQQKPKAGASLELVAYGSDSD